MSKNPPLYLELFLDKVPPDAMRVLERADGSKAMVIRLVAFQRPRADKFGNTHSLSVYRTKTERAEKKPAPFVGKGKFLFRQYDQDQYPFPDDESNEQ